MSFLPLYLSVNLSFARRNSQRTLTSISSIFAFKIMKPRKNKAAISISLIVFSVFLLEIFIHNDDLKTHPIFPFQAPNKPNGTPNLEEDDEELKSPPESCDFFTGKWVLDNQTRPLYRESECKFLSEQVTCLRNGRKDSMYQKLRWQPRDCSLPKFRARLLMRKLRNKRFMFVGDSLNRNQWESMVCLVHSADPQSRTSIVQTGSLTIAKFEDYNATVEFYWAPFLVESNSDAPDMHSVQNRIITPESIEKHAENWKNVHFLVFNTYIWWMSGLTMNVLRGPLDEGLTKYDEIERTIAYRQVLMTLGNWIEEHLNPNQTTVFFNSPSPMHFRSSDWKNPEGIKCAMETKPIPTESEPLNVGTDMRLLAAAMNMTRSLKFPIHFMDITKLSEYRKDAHTSVYTTRQGKMLTAEQRSDPAKFADCVHWCLPGLPDTWNELIYTFLIFRS